MYEFGIKAKLRAASERKQWDVAMYEFGIKAKLLAT